jgi:SAM-dependent methyltransferase
MRIFSGDDRTEAQIREHYELEKHLAARLRNATREERKHLYGQVYDELYSWLPHHPRHRLSQSSERKAAQVESQLAMLRPFLNGDLTVLEVGPGSCHTLRVVAGQVRRAIGVDVAVATTSREGFPSNLELLQFDGINIPLPLESVDLVYSMSVMEHLHPDDAVDQLRSIVRVLKPGGFYVLHTPHRYIGPTDVSKYFDDIATGFHLKEWTWRELKAAMNAAGFTNLRVNTYFKGRAMFLAPGWAVLLELAIGVFPAARRRRMMNHWAVNRVLDIRLVAGK